LATPANRNSLEFHHIRSGKIGAEADDKNTGNDPSTQPFKLLPRLIPAIFANTTMFAIWAADSREGHQGANPTSHIHKPPHQPERWSAARTWLVMSLTWVTMRTNHSFDQEVAVAFLTFYCIDGNNTAASQYAVTRGNLDVCSSRATGHLLASMRRWPSVISKSGFLRRKLGPTCEAPSSKSNLENIPQ